MANSYPPEVAQARRQVMATVHTAEGLGAYGEIGQAVDHLIATVTAAQQQEIERLREQKIQTGDMAAWCAEERFAGNGRCGACSWCVKFERDRAEAAEARYQALRAAVEKWTAKEAEQQAWGKDYDAQGDGANSHTCRGRARIYRECIADVRALRETEPAK